MFLVISTIMTFMKKITSFCLIGAPGRIRTSDRLVRSQVLYPAELRAHFSSRRELWWFAHLMSISILIEIHFFHNSRQNSIQPMKMNLFEYGGERGIRTLDELLTHTPLAGERLQPLGHLSKIVSLLWTVNLRCVIQGAAHYFGLLSTTLRASLWLFKSFQTI